MTRKLDRTATVAEWKETLSRRDDNHQGSTMLLDRLVEIGGLKLGLSVPCPNCSKKKLVQPG